MSTGDQNYLIPQSIPIQSVGLGAYADLAWGNSVAPSSLSTPNWRTSATSTWVQQKAQDHYNYLANMRESDIQQRSWLFGKTFSDSVSSLKRYFFRINDKVYSEEGAEVSALDSLRIECFAWLYN